MCRNFRLPPKFTPCLSSNMKLLGQSLLRKHKHNVPTRSNSLTLLNSMIQSLSQKNVGSHIQRTTVPFVACTGGKWGTWDSDRTYPLVGTSKSGEADENARDVGGSFASNGGTKGNYLSLPSQVFLHVFKTAIQLKCSLVGFFIGASYRSAL